MAKSISGMIVFCLVSLVFQTNAKADSVWELESGQVTYTVTHLLHDSQGTSRAVKGRGHCGKEGCEFLVAAPVKSFESGNANRDTHMLEVVKGALHPIVSVRIDLKGGAVAGDHQLTAKVQFAGQEKTYENLKISLVKEANKIVTKGHWDLDLDDFKIEKPALLGKSIDKRLGLDLTATWIGG
ncbi:MAG: hypothetical protein H6624_05465 [Bdellovibrionaceae bacterium]|nr:hypothetical protein [Bdellovibrionales bacterium]MCB9083768.1 hypothetical protein [Pseudobdellovibrionaceae bacterium]